MKKKQKQQILVGVLILIGVIALFYFQTDSTLSVAYVGQCSLPNCPSGYSLQDKYCEGTTCYGICEKPLPAYCGDYGNWYLKENTVEWDGSSNRGDWYTSPQVQMSRDKCWILKPEARFIPTDMGSAGSFNLEVGGVGRSGDMCTTGKHTTTLGLQERIYGYDPSTVAGGAVAKVIDYSTVGCGGGDPSTNMKGIITTTIRYRFADWIDDEVTTQEVSCSFECSSDSDCGSTGYVGSKTCSGGNVVQNYETNNCQSYQCSSSTEEKIVEFCDYGCEAGVCIQQNLVNYYRLSNNQCSLVQIYQSDAGGNDYLTLSDCESHIQEQDILVYRLDDNCNSAYIKISQRTNNDYDTRELCMAQQSQKQTYYRLSNNECTEVIIYPSDKQSNDYLTLSECEVAIENGNGGDEPVVENLTELIFGGIVVFLLIIFIVVWLVKRTPQKVRKFRR